ncbi:hypothetical protein B0T10DRAFT_472192 [Thelonectria olida]|uniref:BZIP domain-containing protein n=1 Tax=Thelonectria olida TaxID=1576542 RepID=A0A9P9AW31_9HYPO|nr:hypothetical protein B0T10DRAFT_472192 [Thelonectria olida]
MEKSSSQANKPKNPPRRNMEARREQNRIASRNYREKRRQKLALLNQLLEPESSSSTPSSSAPDISHSNLDTNAIIQGDSLTQQPLSYPPVSQLPISQHESTLDIDLSGFDDCVAPIDMNNSQSQSLTPTTFAPYYPVPTTSYPSTHLPDTPFNTMFGPLTTDNFTTNNEHQYRASAFQPSASDNFTPQARNFDEPRTSAASKSQALQEVLRGLDNLSISQKRVLVQLLQYQIQDASEPQPPNPPPSDNPNNPYFQSLTRMQLEALQYAMAIRQTASAGPSRGPNMYRMDAGLFNALFANCFALGMADIAPMLVDDGWSIFGLGPDIAYHPSQLSVVRAKFRNLAPALQPTDKQLTFAHHPYIDVIPYKAFRDKVLEALDHEQPLLDEDILCEDLLTGLTCWGSQQNALGMGAAVPWDVRSWEPSLWFLNKYRDLVGGWEDEMWKGARTWHSMRGERVQELDIPSP